MSFVLDESCLSFLLSLANLVFSSCHFLVQSSDYFAYHSFFSFLFFFLIFFFIAAINIPKEPKIAAGLMTATTPTSAIPVALLLWVLVIFFPLCFLQSRPSSLNPFLHFAYSL